VCQSGACGAAKRIARSSHQGYTISTVERLLPTLIDVSVDLLELPLARGPESDLDGFEGPIPIPADESAPALADIERLVGRFRAVNIKLDKCGALVEAVLSHICDQLRLGVPGLCLGVRAWQRVGKTLQVID
jgi:L-Ala-D/L-Glu epimerase